MRKFRFLASFIVAVLLVGAGLVSSAVAHGPIPEHRMRDTLETSWNHSCKKMWRALRKRLRDEAKRDCVMNHGSYGSNKLRGERFVSETCQRAYGQGTSTQSGYVDYICK